MLFIGKRGKIVLMALNKAVVYLQREEDQIISFQSWHINPPCGLPAKTQFTSAGSRAIEIRNL